MSTELAVVNHRDLIISPVMDLQVARSRMAEFQEFVAHYLEPSVDGGQDGGDYGPIPGAGKKKVLLKSGADKLCELYALYDDYEIEAQEDFGTKLFYYKIKCILKSRRDDSIVGTGVGSCSTYESKYRWRDSQRTCPQCGAAAIIPGREEWIKADGMGAWLCFSKKGGCNAKFKRGDSAIESQTIGRVENPDIMDTVNTVLKMAKKRAKIDAVIGVTRSSGIFTQDLDDVPMPPPKPEVARTTEDIPLESAASNKGKGGKPQEGNPPAAAVPVVAEIVEEAKLSVGYISVKEQKEFHAACRGAVEPSQRTKADGYTYQWLMDNHYLNSKGEPSASAIPAKDWPQARDRAKTWVGVQ